MRRTLSPRPRLNPCYNGIKMKELHGIICPVCVFCLNPCYNGIKMKAKNDLERFEKVAVLILVIME